MASLGMAIKCWRTGKKLKFGICILLGKKPLLVNVKVPWRVFQELLMH